MPIKSLEQKNRQQILLFVFFGIVVVILIILYFSLWRKAPSEETAPLAVPVSQRSQLTPISEEKLEEIKNNFDFLNEKILTFLKIHGDLPVEKGETGRDNPYVPY